MPKRIAIVEDNPDSLLLIGTILQEFYEVASYRSGAQAMKGIVRHPPDLIILDISLPDIQGPQLLEKIRAVKQLQQIPVVALTGHSQLGYRQHCLSVGFDDYVSKPILDDDALLSKVRLNLGETRK